MSDEFETYKVDPSSQKITGLTFINMLAKALGINFPVRRIVLDARMDDVQTIVIESIMRNEQGEKVAVLLSKNFELHQISEEQTPIEPS